MQFASSRGKATDCNILGTCLLVVVVVVVQVAPSLPGAPFNILHAGTCFIYDTFSLCID